ncbi:MAG: hypothetical protein CMH56_04220 [Myxococcales bacterium]|nr:hypothetical protein [Myxococcales bacterium]|tara:strand:- start:5679 stop:6632 length:954 start_codon:yes stop_codon:yes gene_type:complete
MFPSLIQKAIDEGYLSACDAETVWQDFQRQENKDLARYLLLKGKIPELPLLDLLADKFRMPKVNLSDIQKIEPDMKDRFPQKVAIENRLLPVLFENKRCAVAVDEEPSVELLDQLSLDLGVFVYPKVTTSLHLDYGLHALFGLPLGGSARQWLKGKTEQEGLSGKPNDIQAVLEEAKKGCQRAAFLSWQRGVLRGWSMNEGDAMAQDFRGLVFDIRTTDIWSAVLQEGKPFWGALPKDDPVKMFFENTAPTAYVLPIRLHQKVVGALYVDNGSKAVPSEKVSHIQDQCRLLVEILQQRLKKIQRNAVTLEVVQSSAV